MLLLLAVSGSFKVSYEEDLCGCAAFSFDYHNESGSVMPLESVPTC